MGFLLLHTVVAISQVRKAFWEWFSCKHSVWMASWGASRSLSPDQQEILYGAPSPCDYVQNRGLGPSGGIGFV